MTSEQTHQAVRKSFALIAPRSDIAALLFFQKLFELDPALRLMFCNDIEQQGKKLMQALALAVANLDQPGTLRPFLEKLGRDHATYGVQEAHYATAGTALLWALERALASAFTPEAKEAWTLVYSQIAGIMKEAAKGGS